MDIRFSKEKITQHIWRIKGCGDVCMYYITGEDKGLLVDTGYGVGDLKTFIEETFHQPYEVVCTHGHWDHADGAGQ